MSQHILSTIHKTSLEIYERRDIPSRLLETLEKHLRLICTSYPRQSRSKSLRARRDIRSYYKQKRAQKVYLDILDHAPQIFLPFILVVTPKACEKLNNVADFCEQINAKHIDFRQNTTQTFQKIAERHGLSESSHYKKVMQTLFAKPARPVTTAEGAGYEYHLADAQNIRMVLGDRIFYFLNSALLKPGDSRQETDCVGTCIPRNNFQDAIIYLQIRQAHELATILFPASKRNKETASVDCSPVRLSGASMSAVTSLFHFRICDAIEKSQLRLWESKYSSQEVTDCVTLGLDRIDSDVGVLKLRTDFTRGISIVKDLYAVRQSILDVPLYI